MQFWQTLITFACLVSFVIAGTFDAPHVESLTAKSFQKVFDRSDPTLVVFYAPWCGHCQRLSPSYAKAAANLAGMAGQFSAVDCDASENKQLCAQHGIQGFPTIKLFPGNPRKVPLDYNGERSAQALVNYMLSHQKSKVKKHFRADHLIPAVTNAKDSKPLSLLISPKSEVKPLYKALSNTLSSQLDFHFFVDSNHAKNATAAKLSNELKTLLFDNQAITQNKNGPTLLFVQPLPGQQSSTNTETNLKVVKYSGEFKLNKLESWFRDNVKDSLINADQHDEL